MSIKNLFRRRGLATVALAAVVATAVAVTPSFAGSFLSRKAAHSIYLSKKSSKKLFVTQKNADKEYVAQTDGPFALAASSTAAFTSDALYPTLVPASDLTFKMPDTGLVVVTFSGVSSCVAVTSGTGKSCPIRLFVDGQLASTGAQAFDLTNSKAQAHAVTQTAIVQKGTHAVDVAYGGNQLEDITFTLSSWNLVVQGYPGASAP
jgi:hypothetical protein